MGTLLSLNADHGNPQIRNANHTSKAAGTRSQKPMAREFVPHLWMGTLRFNTRQARACRNFRLISSEVPCLPGARARAPRT
jgi:hypothetical protein